MTIQKILLWAKKKIKPLDAEFLLCHFLKKDRTFLFSHPEHKLNLKIIRQFKKAVEQLKKGIPLAYIIHRQEFYGLDFYVDKNVLIPRPETEILVEKVLDYIQQSEKINARGSFFSQITIADIGTGSGNIAIALANKLKIINYKLKIFSIDISEKALKVAKRNTKKYKVQKYIEFLQGNLLEPLKFCPERSRRIDIIIANLPYLDLENFKKQFPKIYQTVKFEPEIALAGGQSGIELIKKLLIAAPKYLKSGGAIFLEIDPLSKKLLSKFIQMKLPEFKFEFFKDYQNKSRYLILIKN